MYIQDLGLDLEPNKAKQVLLEATEWWDKAVMPKLGGPIVPEKDESTEQVASMEDSSTHADGVGPEVVKSFVHCMDSSTNAAWKKLKKDYDTCCTLYKHGTFTLVKTIDSHNAQLNCF